MRELCARSADPARARLVRVATKLTAQDFLLDDEFVVLVDQFGDVLADDEIPFFAVDVDGSRRVAHELDELAALVVTLDLLASRRTARRVRQSTCRDEHGVDVAPDQFFLAIPESVDDGGIDVDHRRVGVDDEAGDSSTSHAVDERIADAHGSFGLPFGFFYFLARVHGFVPHAKEDDEQRHGYNRRDGGENGENELDAGTRVPDAPSQIVVSVLVLANVDLWRKRSRHGPRSD